LAIRAAKAEDDVWLGLLPQSSYLRPKNDKIAITTTMSPMM
jgi:hypothetical protein